MKLVIIFKFILSYSLLFIYSNNKDVIKVSKQFLPNMAKGFDHPKLNLYIGDGFEFMNNHKNEFDVIITDSSDPEGKIKLFNTIYTYFKLIENFIMKLKLGPAQTLFQTSYYQLMNNALRENGIVCCQGI